MPRYRTAELLWITYFAFMMQALIDNVHVFVALSPEEEALLSASFTMKTFHKRQYLLQEGDLARHRSFIVKGVTRTYEVDDKGYEHILQFGVENWWVGDLYSFLTGAASRYNIDCLEETTVLQITHPELEMLYQRVPAMERYFRIIVENTFIASTKRISSNLANSALEQYEEFIRRFPQVEERVPNQHIASYLGITPQSLSRLRRQAADRRGAGLA